MLHLLDELKISIQNDGVSFVNANERLNRCASIVTYHSVVTRNCCGSATNTMMNIGQFITAQ